MLKALYTICLYIGLVVKLDLHWAYLLLTVFVHVIVALIDYLVDEAKPNIGDGR